MNLIFSSLFVFLFLSSSSLFAFAEVYDFSTDKSLYHKDDQLTISGTLSYDPEIPFVTIQIFTPGKSNFADFNTIPANPNGSFSATFNVGGPTWTSDGIYTIKVTYDGNLEKLIEYQELSEPKTAPTSEPKTAPTSEPKTAPTSEPETAPKLEPSTTFTTLKLIIPNFPALDKSPQYYIDRYNNEQSYRSWFDSQFPDSSIYNILGYEDPVSVPNWIRNNAEWWATGQINDSAFVSGLEFMLENNIIMVSTVPSGTISDDEIPEWIRNNAHWWSQDLISEGEFVNSLEYLIKEGIITVN
jgi:hypothetical protein